VVVIVGSRSVAVNDAGGVSNSNGGLLLLFSWVAVDHLIVVGVVKVLVAATLATELVVGWR
jgi:hypothetical protein